MHTLKQLPTMMRTIHCFQWCFLYQFTEVKGSKQHFIFKINFIKALSIIAKFMIGNLSNCEQGCSLLLAVRFI